MAAGPAAHFDVRLALLELSQRPGKEDETRRKWLDLTRDYAERPEPQSALGYLVWRAGEREQAVKAFGAAFELGGRNPQMLWDYGRLAGNSDPSGATRALTALLADHPARVDVRLVLARIQMARQQVKEALETLAPVKVITSEDAPRLYKLLACGKIQTGEPADARANGLRWLEAAKAPDDHERAAAFIRSLDVAVKARTAVPAAPVFLSDDLTDGPPRLTRGEIPETLRPAGGLYSQLPSVEGEFMEFNCGEKVPRFVVKTRNGTVSLLMAEPEKVVISGTTGATIDLNCGPQAPARVRVEYEPGEAASGGISGTVRAITFRP